MKNFTSFLKEAGSIPEQPNRISDDLVTTFGRHNPPHLGHGKTFDRANEIAKSIGDKSQADQRFFTSQTQDPKKNPLPFQMKLHYLKKMFPQHADKWSDDQNIRTVLQAGQQAHQQGYKNFHYVGGGDRRQGFEDLLRRYNGQLYDFKNIYSHNAGDRDENADPDDPIAQMSASKLRNAALNGDYEKFSEGMGINKNFTIQDARGLFQQLRMYMQKNEEWEVDYRSHKEFIREVYREGMLFKPGDVVESLSYGLIGEVHRCGTNHVIVVTEDGIMFKSFIHDLQSI